MSEKIWAKFLTPRDQRVFAAAGYGVRQGFGKRPALMVVDVTYGFCGDRPEPILDSLQKWPTSCGEEAWRGIEVIKTLLHEARDRQMPIIYTANMRRPDNWDAGSFAWKNTRTRDRSPDAAPQVDRNTIVAEVAPQSTDIVVYKPKPSAFFAAPTQSYLVQLGVDSLIVVGTTTSGCVRATVVDAFSNNYRVAVVEEGCFDRSEASHAMSLCDMHAKYADVVGVEEAVSFIRTLERGQFELPRGS